MRRELNDDEIVVHLPNDDYGILVKLRDDSISFKKDKMIGESVFFWMDNTYCYVNSDDWSKIKEWQRNNKIDDILE